MKVLDLFSGIGGFSLGLERAGFETVAFCEIDEHAQQVLRKHWPGVPIYTDVREVTLERLQADGIDRVDVVTGGFPCQDLSCAGNEKGITGERSGLWSELCRITGELRPGYTLVENVTNLLIGERGAWFGRVLGDLAEIGYDAEWHCIPAAAVGAPHLRERVWVVAYPASIGQPESNQLVRLVLEDVESDTGTWNGRRVDKPGIERVVDGIPGQLDRLKRCGNSVVPQIPEMLGRAIMLAEGHASRSL